MSYFIDNSENYKANAKRRRDMGRGSTAKIYATSDAMYAARGGNVGPGTWDRCLIEARTRWQVARDNATEDYRRAAFPERYDDCPF